MRSFSAIRNKDKISKHRHLQEKDGYRLLVENARDIIYYLRLVPFPLIEYINPVVQDVLGFRPEEFYDRQDLFRHIIHHDDAPLYTKILEGTIDFNRLLRLRHQLKNGQEIWLEHSLTPTHNQFGRLIALQGIARDVTEKIALEMKLSFSNLHDPLTGLYNRTYYEQSLHFLGEKAFNVLGVILCDIDRLKLINDTMGHYVGDKLLLATASIIKTSLPDVDIKARIGGDEFIILIPDATRDKVEQYCHLLKQGVLKYNQENSEPMLSISLGYAINTPDNAKPITEIIKEADYNMYRKKLMSSQSSRSSLVQTLIQLMGERDGITSGHAERLSNIVVRMAEKLGLSEQRKTNMLLLSRFHDIGKIAISDRILYKPGPLTPDEYLDMKRHSEIGYRIATSTPDLIPVANFILHHHEWWNGQGYPSGYAKEEIPLECRILALADAYDAMTNDRPYRKALSSEAAIQEIIKKSGSQFDPRLVRIFIEVISAKNGANYHDLLGYEGENI